MSKTALYQPSIYSETMSGHAISEKVAYYKIVCTAFAICTTNPTKNNPTFDAYRNHKRCLHNCMLLYMLAECQFKKISNLMLCDIAWYVRNINIPSSLNILPKKKYNYVHFLHKIEDAWRIVGCIGIDGVAVCTWHQKLSDHSGRRKKEGSSHLCVHQWLMIHHFIDVKVSKFTNISNLYY